MRAVFTRAHKSGLIAANPALLVGKPRRLPSRRGALNQAELAEMWDAVTATTCDPDLDLLLVRFHLESGARRQGAINLTIGGIDPDRQTVWLREKFGAEREQPISATLLAAVVDLAASRGSTEPNDAAFRTLRRRDGVHLALSDRTYDRIFTRAQDKVSWAQRTPMTAHVLRHTAIRAVERLYGRAVAQAFAGHRPETDTDSYAKADIHEVATAVAALTGEPHPLTRSRLPD